MVRESEVCCSLNINAEIASGVGDFDWVVVKCSRTLWRKVMLASKSEGQIEKKKPTTTILR